MTTAPPVVTDRYAAGGRKYPFPPAAAWRLAGTKICAGQVASPPVCLVPGVTVDGDRDILDLRPGRSATAWNQVLAGRILRRYLKARIVMALAGVFE